jgi:folate-binding protein YgfZ
VSDVAPFPTAPSPHVVRLDPASRATTEALGSGALIAQADVAVLELLGPGAVSCMQGLLTNDVESPGDGGFVFGALLTPKGMIVADGWVARSGASVRYTVPALGHEPGAALFARSVPPRLARTIERTADLVVWRLAGPHATAVARAAGLPVPPDPGRRLSGPDDVEVARPSDAAPFALQITAPRERADAVVEHLVAAGARSDDPTALELGRILAGWPALGAEVDAKTIPQEVRYDEIGGVSYTKGCYTGQETVSRLHFRGHANRQLLGLEFDARPAALDPMPVTHEDRDAGRVTSVAGLPGDRWIGLAVLRREVPAGATVRAAGTDARLVALPFEIGPLAPA